MTASSSKKKQSTAGHNVFILDRKDIPGDKNAYIYRDAKRGGRWVLYFYNYETKGRHRFVLKDPAGKHPPATTEGQDEAWMLGIARFVELKGKSDRGEAIQSLTWKEMTDKFLLKEMRRSKVAGGISPARYRLIRTQLKWVSDYVNDENKPVHKFRRNSFLNYEIWRKERALEFGKEAPQQTTINQEISTLRRCFNEVAVSAGYLTRDSVPELPQIKLPRDKKHRRDDFTDKEWEELEKVMRYYWIKGKTRLVGENYETEQDSSGQYKVKWNVGKKGEQTSERGRRQIVHREMLYLMMRISMDTGIRIGSLRQMKWKHIESMSSLPKKEQLIWKALSIPPENNKNRRFYRIAAPIAKHLKQLEKTSQFTKGDDYLFCNQRTGNMFSKRILHDSLCEVLVEARIADWAEDDSNNQRKISIHSGKNLTWYSFRHTHITMRLKAGVPVATIAANTDTGLKYIEQHYFHYRVEEATGQLSMGRRLKPALTELKRLEDPLSSDA